jgi:hypothetical protein
MTTTPVSGETGDRCPYRSVAGYRCALPRGHGDNGHPEHSWGPSDDATWNRRTPDCASLAEGDRRGRLQGRLDASAALEELPHLTGRTAYASGFRDAMAACQAAVDHLPALATQPAEPAPDPIIAVPPESTAALRAARIEGALEERGRVVAWLREWTAPTNERWARSLPANE